MAAPRCWPPRCARPLARTTGRIPAAQMRRWRRCRRQARRRRRGGTWAPPCGARSPRCCCAWPAGRSLQRCAHELGGPPPLRVLASWLVRRQAERGVPTLRGKSTSARYSFVFTFKSVQNVGGVAPCPQDKGSARVASQVLSALAHLAPDLVLVSARSRAPPFATFSAPSVCAGSRAHAAAGGPPHTYTTPPMQP